MSGHVCDDNCNCPIHGTQLLWSPARELHACVDASCINGQGMEADFTRPNLKFRGLDEERP